MFGWFRIKSPLTADPRKWVDSRFAWLLNEFGHARLNGTVITPTDEFFPEPYAGTTEDAAVLLNRICRYMDVDASRVELSFYTSAAADDVRVSVDPTARGFALGIYSEARGHLQIRLEQTRVREPQSVVATLAHELGHVHLLGDRRCSADTSDHEPLTDLLTVFFGMGIFTANNVIREANWRVGRFSGWNVARQGYLLMAEFAYALAVYALNRGEFKPDWVRYLRPDVRALFKTELKQLVAKGAPHNVADADPSITDRQIANRDDLSHSAIDSKNDDSELGIRAENEEGMAGAERDDCESDDICDSAEDQSADELFSRAVTYTAEGRHDLAAQACSQSLLRKPRDAEVRLHRAESYIALGRFAEAVDDCELAMQREPEDAAIYRCRATALLWLRQWSAALEDLNVALREDKRDPRAYILRGIAQAGLGQYRSAMSDYEKAIRFAPIWADIYLARSQAYAALGDKERSEADVIEAIRRDPALNDHSRRLARLAGRPLLG